MNNYFLNNIIFNHMIILGISLGLFVVGGGLISLTNALSKRQ